MEIIFTIGCKVGNYFGQKGLHAVPLRTMLRGEEKTLGKPDETIAGGGEPGRGQRKVGMYLPADMIDHLRIVGAGLQARGFSGNLSDTLRLILSVAKKQGLLDAAKLVRIASETGQFEQ